MSQSALVWKAVITHDKRRQAVRERIHARPWLCVGAFVGPYDVEARVDVRDGDPVQG